MSSEPDAKQWVTSCAATEPGTEKVRPVWSVSGALPGFGVESGVVCVWVGRGGPKELPGPLRAMHAMNAPSLPLGQLLQLLEEHVSRPGFLLELEAARTTALAGDAPQPPSSPGTAARAGEGLQADWWEVRSDGEFAAGGRGGMEWEEGHVCAEGAGGGRTAGSLCTGNCCAGSRPCSGVLCAAAAMAAPPAHSHTRFHNVVSECTGDYVVVEHSDVILAFSYFIAAYVVTLPEATSSDTRQLQTALAQTMQVSGACVGKEEGCGWGKAGLVHGPEGMAVAGRGDAQTCGDAGFAATSWLSCRERGRLRRCDRLQAPDLLPSSWPTPAGAAQGQGSPAAGLGTDHLPGGGSVVRCFFRLHQPLAGQGGADGAAHGGQDAGGAGGLAWPGRGLLLRRAPAVRRGCAIPPAGLDRVEAGPSVVAASPVARACSDTRWHSK